MANKEIKNILLVEGDSDSKFFQTLIKYLGITNAILNFDLLRFDAIGGSDKKLLEFSIRSLEVDLRSNPIEKFGIVLDLDDYENDSRFKQVHEILIKIFGEQNVLNNNDNSFNVKLNDLKTILVDCHFIENDLVTNLELLLKEIVTQDPLAANCLKHWFDCAINSGRKIRKSDYLKFWREVYVRYDYCSNPDLRKHSVENCTTEKSFDNMFIDGKPQAWNFESPLLNNLKTFLASFSNE